MTVVVHETDAIFTGDVLSHLDAQLVAARRLLGVVLEQGAAIDAGYTEPDPRVDLSGVDVARKALILARAIGFRGELSDVAVESLLAPEWNALPLDAFLSRISELDVHWDVRVAAARNAGNVLRYRARVTSRSITVGIVETPAHGRLGALEGTDNQFTFTTARYHAQPLVITGPGAGPAVTAAGVNNDILSLLASKGAPRASRFDSPIPVAG